MANLIDRAKAIKAIEDMQDCYNGFSGTYDKAQIIGVLEEVPTAESKWIPISEQMPKKAGNYLVTDHKGDIARFIFLDSKSSKDYWMRCVKAWMPLPKPYKEGD